MQHEPQWRLLGARRLPLGHNAATQSVFSTLMTERTHRTIYQTREEAKADVFRYIEQFYNLRRRYSTLDYVSPADFEKAAGMC